MQILSEPLFQLLGLPEKTGHRFEALRQVGSDGVHALVNEFGVAYLLLAYAGDGVEKRLRSALRESPLAGSAILLRKEGTDRRAFRKNFRTGDVEVTAGLDRAWLASESTKPGSSERRRILQPLTHHLENVLFDVHSTLRDVDGLHAPDALDEICKIIYAKIFDEGSAAESGVHRFQRALYHSNEECAASVRALYFDALKNDRQRSSSCSSVFGQARGAFREPLTLSNQAIVRAVSLLEKYDLSGSPVDIKGRAFQKVLMPATRAGMGQYFTPKAVIDLTMSLLNPSVHDTLIDPFCGSGHFLVAARDHVRRKKGSSTKQLGAFALDRLHGIEKSARMVRIATTDLHMQGDYHSNIRCADALLPFESYPDIEPESFDIIATNPPFGVEVPANALAELGPFRILGSQKRPRSVVPLEVVALERCLSLLRPGGRMAIVVPESILGNRGMNFVREWIAEHALIRGIISLPAETFSPFGASIKTSVLLLRKFRDGEDKTRSCNVFLADIRMIGHDAAGRLCGCDDFAMLERQFAEFIAAEGW